MYHNYEDKQLNPQEIISRHFADMGRKGGKSNVDKYGKEHMRRIGMKGVEARKKKRELGLIEDVTT